MYLLFISSSSNHTSVATSDFLLALTTGRQVPRLAAIAFVFLAFAKRGSGARWKHVSARCPVFPHFEHTWSPKH